MTKKKRLSISFEDEVIAVLEMISKRKGLNKSSYIATLINADIEKMIERGQLDPAECNEAIDLYKNEKGA